MGEEHLTAENHLGAWLLRTRRPRANLGTVPTRSNRNRAAGALAVSMPSSSHLAPTLMIRTPGYTASDGCRLKLTVVRRIRAGHAC